MAQVRSIHPWVTVEHAQIVPCRRVLPTRTREKVTRRIELRLHKPWFALYARIKPTLVIGGRGQPVQWGLGTWQVPADQTVVIGVFLFNRLWRFGQAEFALEPDQTPSLVYRAPVLPFLRGRIRLDENGPEGALGGS